MGEVLFHHSMPFHISLFHCFYMHSCWLLFRFLHSIGPLYHSGYLETVNVELLISLYRNLSPSLFLLSSMVESHASACNDSIGDVLNAPVYILIPSLCMLSNFLVSLRRLNFLLDTCILRYVLIPSGSLCLHFCFVYFRFLYSIIKANKI